MLVEKNEIKNGWIEYIWESFHGVRGASYHFPDSTEGPKILKSELRIAITMMRRNNAAGPNEIVVEM